MSSSLDKTFPGEYILSRKTKRKENETKKNREEEGKWLKEWLDKRIHKEKSKI